MTVTPKTKDLASEWREARLLHPLYSALAREFVIELPACQDLEAGIDDPPQESVEQARQWFLDMDQKIQVHQLRQFLQTTNLTSEEGLQTLLEHHLHRATRIDSDRDKIDFLLVQYFSHCAPSRLEDTDGPDAGSGSGYCGPHASRMASTDRGFHRGRRRMPEPE